MTVSEGNFEFVSNQFPEFKNKLYMIRDMIDYQLIVSMSSLLVPDFDINKFNILTVARLNKTQKGYDITLEACKILKEQNKEFHWYAIGEGSYKKEMEEYISENDLSAYFTFLGTTANPYPYFKHADLYVQTSRHEGYGLSIAEARLLNTPVVTTNYDTVLMQMKHEKNGLITDMDARAVANGILRFMEDKMLYSNVVSFLENEPKENLELLLQFYNLVD